MSESRLTVALDEGEVDIDNRGMGSATGPRLVTVQTKPGWHNLFGSLGECDIYLATACPILDNVAVHEALVFLLTEFM